MTVKKITALFVSLGLLFLWGSQKIISGSDNKPSVAVKTTYDILPDGVTIVTQNFSLSNIPRHLIPKEFFLELTKVQLTSLEAFSAQENLDASYSSSLEKTTIKVSLNQNTDWTIKYQTADFVRRIGRLWEVAAPESFRIEGIKELVFNYQIPENFGKEIIKNKLYDPYNLPLSYQAYDFSFTHYLVNKRPYPSLISIPIMGDNDERKVFLDEVNPKPHDIVLGKNNQWLVRFLLPAKSQLVATISGSLVQILTPNKLPVKLPKDFKPVDKSLDLNSLPKISLQIKLPPKIISGFATKIEIEVKNYGPTTLEQGVILVKTNNLPLEENFKEINFLFPYSSKKVDFIIKPTDWQQSLDDIITIQLGNLSQTYPVSLRPFWHYGINLLIKILLFIAGIIVLTKLARCISLSRFARRCCLCRKSG